MSLWSWLKKLRKVHGRKQARSRAYKSEVLAVRMKLVEQKRRKAGKHAR